MSKHLYFSDTNKAYLDHMVWQQALPNGLIFHGPQGSFNDEAADYVVRLVHCVSSEKNGGPCGDCSSCKLHETGNHTDYILINSDKQIVIDSIRWLKESTKYGPSTSKHLMVVIERAETMTIGAANAFLKLLEEPAEGVHFILLTTSADALLSTIVSRSQPLYFPKTSKATLLTALNDLPVEGDSDPHLETLKNQYDALLVSLLHGQDLPEIDSFKSLTDLSSMSSFERLTYAQSIPSKPVAKLYCFMWLQDALTSRLSKNMKADIQLEKLIEIIQNLKYNLNLKLQMERLLVNL